MLWKLRISGLKLINFRNYKFLDIGFEPSVNIIHGENAQGKTNILEAVFLCACGRSHRTARDMDIIRMDEKGYYIKVEVEKKDSISTIEINYERRNKKNIKVNEITVSKIGKLMGNLNVVIFSPEDLMIIKEGPSERRRFVDITISQMKPSYFFDLQQYSRILFQRNNLLRGINTNEHLKETLDVWDYNLIKIGARIMKARNEFVERLTENVRINHEKLTNKKEELKIKYLPSLKCNDLNDINGMENEFKKKLDLSRKKEIEKGTTMYGPQRDEIEILLDGKNIKIFGSQGQQRTAVLSIKLSEIDIMKEETQDYPILLLDDVMSELDEKRQKYLLKNIENVQTFITCTDASYFINKIPNGSGFYAVQNGEVEKI